MTMQTVSVSSSNLDSIGYDRDSQTLEVTFINGSVYQYQQVPNDVVGELLAAGSHGSYFQQNIRDNYTFTKVS